MSYIIIEKWEVGNNKYLDFAYSDIDVKYSHISLEEMRQLHFKKYNVDGINLISKLRDKPQIFFTSDLHFGHKNIIKYEDRPFTTVAEMDEVLIDNWNNLICDNDTVYVLGDFTFSKDKKYVEYLCKSLNGEKHLIIGNHDYFAKENWAREYFKTISQYKEITIAGRKICMFHYPIAVWNKKHHGSLHLYGHLHSNKEGHHYMEYDLGKNAINVGVDVNNFKPISFKELCIATEE